jgi:3'-5' exoribonuclease
MVEEKISQLKGFSADLAMRLKHLILSHHGQFEFGSPKRPKFKEAFALHLIDDLDAKMNGLGRFIEMDTKEGPWTEYNRLFERYFLKGGIEILPPAEQVNDQVQEGEQERLFKY